MQKRIRDACGPRVRVVLLSSILTQHHPRGTSGISGGAPRIPVVSNSLYRPEGHGGHPPPQALLCKRRVDGRRGSSSVPMLCRSWSMSSTPPSSTILKKGCYFFWLSLSTHSARQGLPPPEDGGGAPFLTPIDKHRDTRPNVHLIQNRVQNEARRGR